MGYLIRPLGLREQRIGFEVQRGALPAGVTAQDIREAFTLWDPHGRPHAAYPEMEVTRAMSGREVMQWQEEAWQRHASEARRLFGAAPLAGVHRAARPLRGLLLFPIEIFSERGRWTLAHHAGFVWYFTPAQIRHGLPRAQPPARDEGASR